MIKGISFSKYKTSIKSDKYKHVFEITQHDGFVYYMANTKSRSKVLGKTCSKSLYYETEREAAVSVDKMLLSIGKQPVNILIKKPL